MKSLAILALILVPGLALAQSPRVPQRDFEEMTGDCTNYLWNMKAEFELAKKEPASVRAAANAEKPPELKLDANNDVTLLPSGQVSFPVRPERDRSGPATFSGVVRITVPANGVYKISSSPNNWMDVARGTSRLTALGFENQPKCEPVFKSIAYSLNAGETYILQISGTLSPFVTVMVTKWAE